MEFKNINPKKMVGVVLFILLLSVAGMTNLFAQGNNTYHWNVNIHQFPDNMTVTGAIFIDNVQQSTSSLEIGAFCGTECRGRQLLSYYPQVGGYLVFLVLYGVDYDMFTFRLYDHNLGEEFDVTCSNTVTFITNATLGTPTNPYVFEFFGTNPPSPPLQVNAEYFPDANDPYGSCVRVYWSWNTPSSIIEDFETYDFSQFDWQLDPNYPWQTTFHYPYEGVSCMKSGNQQVLSSSSTMQVTVDIPADGEMSFWGRISSESGWDYGYFYIDNVQMGSYTGISSWEERTFPITAGVHTFKWEYTEDYLISQGEDCFCVDYITFYRSPESREGRTVELGAGESPVKLSTKMFVPVNGQSKALAGAECITPNAATAETICKDDRTLENFRVYRAQCGGSGATLIADNITQNVYFDLDWPTLAPGYYQYGVCPVSGSTTNISWSNCIVKPGGQTTYQITAIANPIEGGTISGAGTYNYGETATLIATPEDGYTFLNWTKQGEIVSTNFNYSFTVTENATLVANFGEACSVFFDLYDSYGDGWNGNQLVVTFTDATPTQHFLTLQNGSSASYYIVISNGVHVTLSWIQGSYFNECSFTVRYENDAVIYQGAGLGSSTFEFDVDCNTLSPTSTITQTTNFTSGWNWWSGYVELSGASSLQSLENGLGTHGVMVKSQNNGYASYLTGYGWYGSLTSINNECTYQVKTNAGCTVSLSGNAANPASHPVTLTSGWTWVGYPVNASMSVSTALAGITPQSGDMLKSQNNGYASYLAGFGWYGSLNTLQPGMGLMYKSNNSSNITLTYPNSGTRTDLKPNQTSENNHWQPNLNAYPDNMSVMAVVELDGEELALRQAHGPDNYELAAFANGEVRGSARLLYVEPINRYMAFLTVAGDEPAELHFGLYNTEIGEVEAQCITSLQYETNAIIGSFAEPYIVRFRHNTGLDEWDNFVNLFPNPVERGQKVSLGFNDMEMSEVQVEIINALGSVVETRRATSLQTITAPETAGVYTLRITVEGKGMCYRKLIVK